VFVKRVEKIGLADVLFNYTLICFVPLGVLLNNLGDEALLRHSLPQAGLAHEFARTIFLYYFACFVRLLVIRFKLLGN